MDLKAHERIGLLIAKARKIRAKAVAEHKDFTYVTVKVSNPYDPKASEKVRFLVDTGAACCAIPEALKERLRLPDEGGVEIVMADGRPVPMKVAQVVMELAGRIVEIWVAYGPNIEPILGMNVLGRLGIHVDTKDRVAMAPLRRFTYRNLVFYGNFRPLYGLEGDGKREEEGRGSDPGSNSNSSSNLSLNSEVKGHD